MSGSFRFTKLLGTFLSPNVIYANPHHGNGIMAQPSVVGSYPPGMCKVLAALGLAEPDEVDPGGLRSTSHNGDSLKAQHA